MTEMFIVPVPAPVGAVQVILEQVPTQPANLVVQL